MKTLINSLLGEMRAAILAVLLLRPESLPRCSRATGTSCFDHYRHAFEALGNEKGTLGLIFCRIPC